MKNLFKVVVILFLAVIFLPSVYSETVQVNKTPFHAQEATPQGGWTPKWNVGDWWVVNVEYDAASSFDPGAGEVEPAPDPQTAVVKYSIVTEEDLGGEKVLKLRIRQLNKTRGGVPEFDVWISKENYSIHKINIYHEDSADEEYIYDKGCHDVYVHVGNFHLYTFPIFPLPAKREYNKEKGGQVSGPIDLTSLSQNKKINKKFLQGKLYIVSISPQQMNQYWSESAPWCVYFDVGGVQGYLRKYHVNASK